MLHRIGSAEGVAGGTGGWLDAGQGYGVKGAKKSQRHQPSVCVKRPWSGHARKLLFKHGKMREKRILEKTKNK